MGMPSNFTEILAALSSALECAPLQTDERGRVLFGLDEDMGAVLFTEKNEDSTRNCCAMFCAPTTCGPPPATAPWPLTRKAVCWSSIA